MTPIARSPDISVIICAYDEARWNDLASAIQSAQRQNVPPVEVIVVIDHNPKLLKRVWEAFPDVVAVENRDLPGASGARNSGAAIARGAVVAFLDDDAEALPGWIQQLQAGYEDASVLGVGGAIEPVWLTRRPAWFPGEFFWVIGGTYTGMPETACVVRNLWAGNMSVRREIFDSIGGFRSGYGNVKSSPRSRSFRLQASAGDEETEFCIKALQRWPNRIWLYKPEARVRHKVPAGRTRWRYFQWRCFNEGLGKAQLAKLVSPGNALKDEWAYTFRVLPRGVMRGFQDAIFRRDLTGLARSTAIVSGWLITTAGYVLGLLGSRTDCPVDPQQTPEVNLVERV